MPQAMVARVTCPNCQNQFQTPVEQILDVKNDPGAKGRLLNGMVNVSVCPHCNARGGLGIPFLYHDPENELALVYMPMEAGRDDMERQKAIGQLTSAVMDDLPPEERKAYLLQPQVFLTLENMINVVLEKEGITPEMIEAQKAKAELLKRMLEAEDKVLETMITENDASIDPEFLAILSMNIEMAYATQQTADVERLLAVRSKVIELSSEGKVAQARAQAIETLRENPTREKLLELLVESEDEVSREMLVLSARPLLDYAFFQALTSKIDAESDEAEKKRLTALRTEILGVRDRIDEETKALLAERAALLRDLLLSDDPEALARQRAQEIDQAFLSILSSNMEEARTAGDTETLESLQAIWALVLKLMEETLPPEVRLFNRLMSAEDEAEVDKLLEDNQPLVTEHLTQFIEEAATRLEESGGPEVTARITLLKEKVKTLLG